MLNSDNYYEDKHYFSVSEFKRYQKCELDGKTYEPIEMTIPMLIGSYVDAYVEGTLEEFVANHDEIFYADKKKGLKKDFQKAEEICRFIDNDRTLQQFLSGKKQVIMTGEISGVPFKIKMDSYSPNIAINDLKVVATITDNQGYIKDFITPWGYDTQLACYQEIVFQNTGERLPCYIVAVTKEEPINSIIVQVNQEYLDRALYDVQENIERYQEIKIGNIIPRACEICKTCINNRNETPIVYLSDILMN